MESFILVECPHCKDYIFILHNETNCKIFRHGVYKNNYKQIDPHMKKEECDRLKKENLIFGCGKPFKLEFINSNYITKICDYI